MSEWDRLSRVFRSTFPKVEETHFRTDAWRDPTRRRGGKIEPYHPTMLHAFAVAAKHEAEIGITLVPEAEGEPERKMSYRELYHAAMATAVRLDALGVRKGDRILVLLPTGFEFVTTFLGAQFLGAIPCPTYPPSGLRVEMAIDRLCHVAEHAGARFCVTNRRIHAFLGELAMRVPTLEKIVDVEDLPARAERKLHPVVGPEDAAFIQYTSGSTGKPKGVFLSQANVVHNIHAIGLALQIHRGDVTVSWLPLYHDMGLVGTLLFSIYWRIPLVLLSPVSFLLKPSRWLWAIHRHRGTLSPAPNFAYALCTRRVKPAEREGLDLSSWRLAMNGAEPVSYRTIVAFQRMYAPHGFRPEAMLPVYGLAESTLAVTFPPLGRLARYETVDRAALANGHVRAGSGAGSMAIVSVGTPVPGHEVVVVDEHGEPLPEHEVGHILVRGPSTMRGYYRDAAATEAILRGGWLWTGDLGYFSQGELYVTGRAKDLIILRGRNVYAEDLEAVAERVDGVRQGGAVAFAVYDEEEARDVVVMVAETSVADEKLRERLVKEISQRVAEHCDVRLDEVVLVRPRTVPKTSSGKKQRSLCRELYLKHELESARSGKLGLAMVYVRSRAGFLLAGARKVIGATRRRAPD